MKETRDYIGMFFTIIVGLICLEDHFKIDAWPASNFFSHYHWASIAVDILTIILIVFMFLCIVLRIDRPNRKEAQIVIDINGMTAELADIVIETCNELISRDEIKIICKQFEQEINDFFKDTNSKAQSRINTVIDSQFYESLRTVSKKSSSRETAIFISATIKRIVNEESIKSFIISISEKLKANVETILTKELKKNPDVSKLKQAISLKVEELKQNKKWGTIIVSLYPDIEEILSKDFQAGLQMSEINLSNILSLTSTIVGGVLLTDLFSSDFTGGFASSVSDFAQDNFSDLFYDIGGEIAAELIEDMGMFIPVVGLVFLGAKIFRWGRRIFGESKETKIIREMKSTISYDLDNSIKEMPATVNIKLSEAGNIFLVSVKDAFRKSQVILSKETKKFQKYL